MLEMALREMEDLTMPGARSTTSILRGVHSM